jgi:hypothetical protein
VNTSPVSETSASSLSAVLASVLTGWLAAGLGVGLVLAVGLGVGLVLAVGFGFGFGFLSAL